MRKSDVFRSAEAETWTNTKLHPKACAVVKEVKLHYGQKPQSQFQQGDSRSLWQG